MTPELSSGKAPLAEAQSDRFAPAVRAVLPPGVRGGEKPSVAFASLQTRSPGSAMAEGVNGSVTPDSANAPDVTSTPALPRTLHRLVHLVHDLTMSVPPGFP